MRDLESFDDSEKKEVRGKVVSIECRTALSPSNLPGLDYALNPYSGCAHACIYCYAPYVLHCPRDDWGATVKVKSNIPRVIASEVSKRKGVVGIGTVTDPYQSAEARFCLTRRCLQELLKKDLAVSILTKSPLVIRDMDLISKFSSSEVGITVTTQQDDLAAQFEPGAPPPSQRLVTAQELVAGGIETYILIGPTLPGVTDSDLDDFFSKIASTGVRRIMVDKLRIRPGMLAKIRTLPLMKDEERWNGFSENARSEAYYHQLSHRIGELCRRHDLKCSQAF